MLAVTEKKSLRAIVREAVSRVNIRPEERNYLINEIVTRAECERNASVMLTRQPFDPIEPWPGPPILNDE